MVELEEMVYTVKEILRQNNRDSDMSNKQIEYLISTKRSYLLKDKLNKKLHIPEVYNQSLGCLELACVNESCCDEDINVSYYSTVNYIPTPIHINDAPFKYVGLLNKLDSISYKHPNQVEFQRYSRFSSKNPYYTYRANKLYFYNLQGLEFVNIIGVFEDPIAASSVSDCNGNPCGDLKYYPIAPDDKDLIITSIIKSLVPRQNIHNDEGADT